jgi:hypothetical protein
MNNDMLDNISDLSSHRSKISSEKLLMGSTIGKYAVALDDGRTVVFISDKSKEEEIRHKYEELKNKKFPTRSPRHH